MLLNNEVMSTANVGSKKGYFATFFIPPAADDECVFQDIVKSEKDWRPGTSLSHHTSGSSVRSSRSPSRIRKNRGQVFLSDAAKGPNHELGNPERDRASTARSSKALSIMSLDFSESSQPPPPSRSVSRQHSLPGRRPGYPIKYAFDQNKAFATSKDRTQKTCEVIKDSSRGSGGSAQERTCRPYSVYTVCHKRDNIAISPYGEPNLKGAAGRYREQYKHLTNSYPFPDDAEKASRDYVFQKFFENLTLRASLTTKSPIGVLKRPPPKPVRTPRSTVDSKITKLHKQAQDRMEMVQKDLPDHGETKTEGSRRGVEYVIAMEMSQNLEKYRLKRSYSFPSMPTVAVAAATTTRLDAPRLRTQSVNYLTIGESCIKGGIDSNVYDPERKDRAPIKVIERKPRVRSPLLSKLSRDRFLPEAIRRRELEKQESLAGLRIGNAGANTPVTDWKSETTRRPKSTMTTTTKMLLESHASESSEGDLDDEDIYQLENEDDNGLKSESEAPVVESDSREEASYVEDVKIDSVSLNSDPNTSQVQVDRESHENNETTQEGVPKCECDCIQTRGNDDVSAGESHSPSVSETEHGADLGSTVVQENSPDPNESDPTQLRDCSPEQNLESASNTDITMPLNLADDTIQ
ncbi:uncharacterized protein [Diadema antillarum]|uniref:uncharacterized protein n=1 Tax=Diadema antillarum TaxID=105358 RepID=UPI003A8771DE